jgi:hypothetical protein
LAHPRLQLVATPPTADDLGAYNEAQLKDSFAFYYQKKARDALRMVVAVHKRVLMLDVVQQIKKSILRASSIRLRASTILYACYEKEQEQVIILYICGGVQRKEEYDMLFVLRCET